MTQYFSKKFQKHYMAIRNNNVPIRIFPGGITKTGKRRLLIEKFMGYPWLTKYL